MFDSFSNLHGAVPQSLVQLLAIGKKSELKKYAADLVIRQSEFVRLIVNCNRVGYVHGIKYMDWAPPHLEPSLDELNAISSGPDGHATDDSATTLRKISQMFRDRRYLVAHMFVNTQRWHLFYFDQRDLDHGATNHWTGGSHVHFVNDLWPEFRAGQLWNAFDNPKASVPGKLHIRFDEDAPSKTRTDEGEED